MRALWLLSFLVAGCRLLGGAFYDKCDAPESAAVGCQDAFNQLICVDGLVFPERCASTEVCLSEEGCVGFCGNDIIESNEECDDDNATSGDGCDESCVIEFCGDGLINDGGNEACDDANLVNGDGCDNNCKLSCGNAVLDVSEACDDGGVSDGDGCSGLCVIEPGFVCAGSPSVCTSALGVCGDGFIDVGEECDDGSTVNGDGCDSTCLIECGNGATDVNEQCDDGNATNGDNCDSNCTFTTCGNAIITSGEQCDDDNNDDFDGCNAACVLEFCGDGIVNNFGSAVPSVEQCDDGNNINTDGCTNACTFPACGDAIFSDGELCGFSLNSIIGVGDSPSSIIAADLNGAAGPEIAVTNEFSDNVSLFDVNAGVLASTQIILVDDAPQFIIAADLGDPSINTDNDLELIVLSAGIAANSKRVRILDNNGSGTFSLGQFTTGAGTAVAGATGDFAGIGFQDLAFADSNGTIKLLPNNGAEGFGSLSTIPSNPPVDDPVEVVVADFNSDGAPDIAILGQQTDTIGFMLNDGLGGFSLLPQGAATLDSPTAMAAGDFNKDGFIDLVVTNNGTNQVQLFFSDGSCTTGDDCVTAGAIANTALNPQAIKLADLNRDGSLDAIIANGDSDCFRVVLGAGGGFSAAAPQDFLLSAGSFPVDLVVVDLDNDGIFEVITANKNTDNLSIFLALP